MAAPWRSALWGDLSPTARTERQPNLHPDAPRHWFFDEQPDAPLQHQPETSASEPDLDAVEPFDHQEEDQQQQLLQAQQQPDLPPLDLQQLLPQQLHQQLFCLVIAEQPSPTEEQHQQHQDHDLLPEPSPAAGQPQIQGVLRPDPDWPASQLGRLCDYRQPALPDELHQEGLNFMGWVIEGIIRPPQWQLQLFLLTWQLSLRQRLFGFRLPYAMALTIFGARFC